MGSSAGRGARALMVAMGAVAAAVAMVPGMSPRAAGDPGDWPQPGSESASESLEELERLGYSVSTNWVNGSRTVPLNRCRVIGYHSAGIVEQSDADGNADGMAIVMDVFCPDDD